MLSLEEYYLLIRTTRKLAGNVFFNFLKFIRGILNSGMATCGDDIKPNIRAGMCENKKTLRI